MKQRHSATNRENFGKPVKTFLRQLWKLPRPVLAGVAVLAFAAIGTILLVGSHAATLTASFQTESGTLSGNATTVTDSGASGGGAVKFSSTSTFQSNCIVKPSVCGYPDETNTGVPAGTTLTKVPSQATSGPGWGWRSDIRALYPTGSNVTIQNIEIENGFIIMNAANVTLRNVKINSPGLYPIDCNYYDEPSCQNLLMEDMEIHGTASNCLTGMAYSGYTARRVYVNGCQDGFKTDADVVVEDSYISNLWVEEGMHNDCIQTTGGSNVTICHTTCKLGNQDASSLFQFGVENMGNSNWTIENNLLDGGGYVFNTNSSIPGTVVRNNRITRNYVFGVGNIPGSTWTGNYYDDTGAVANPN